MLNKCMFIGHLGSDPEIRKFSNGGSVCNLRLACTEKWKDRETGERKEKTEWISVDVFHEGLIGICEKYLRKGSKVYIEGKFTTRKWQDQSGNDRYSTSVALQGFDSKLIMLDGKSEGGSQRNDQGGGSQDGYGQGGSAMGDMGDEIPFAASVL